MNFNKKVIYTSLLFGLLRIVLLFYHNPNLIMNIDEESNFEVAMNHFQGRGYTYFDPERNGYFPTAFHSSFSIFVYENIVLKNHIHKRTWVSFCNILSGILLALSVWYFFQLSLFFLNEKTSWYCTLMYVIFPSVLYYIGTLFWYEQMVLSLLIIIIYLVIKSLKTSLTPVEWLICVIGITLCSLIRLQTVAIFAPLLLFVISILLIRRHYLKVIIYTGIVLIATVSHFPSLAKNKQIYGHYILSTQTGFELLQGHNPFAKGSWMGDWLLPQSALYQYSHKKIPHIGTLNQYQESKARKAVAIEWIKENPLSELKLAVRKIALYFLPRNFEFLPYHHILNPINLVVYLSFLYFLIQSLIQFQKKWTAEMVILMTPFIGSMALTLIFFMGARWRFYAEPFMIIFTFMLWKNWSIRWGIFKNKFD